MLASGNNKAKHLLYFQESWLYRGSSSLMQYRDKRRSNWMSGMFTSSRIFTLDMVFWLFLFECWLWMCIFFLPDLVICNKYRISFLKYLYSRCTYGFISTVISYSWFSEVIVFSIVWCITWNNTKRVIRTGVPAYQYPDERHFRGM